MKGWIAVDLDGTLAHYDEWKDHSHIGAPIALMVERVKAWIEEGKYDVRIFTARCAPATLSPDKDKDIEAIVRTIKLWCLKHIGYELDVTHEKDFAMVQLWDDRAVGVIPNTGQRADGK